MAEGSIDATIRAAFALHQEGKLAEAETLYREVLRQNPDHIEALHLFGVLAAQAGRPELAVKLIGRATALNPDFTDAHNNLGNALRAQGQANEAIAAYRRAIRLRADYAEAHYNLANLLQGRGQLEEAMAGYREAVRIKPDYVEAYNGMGIILHTVGRLDEAIEAFEEALRRKPNYFEAHNSMGVTLLASRREEEALAAWRHALVLKPDAAEVHNNLGHLYFRRGEIDMAIGAFRQALHFAPEMPEAHNNLGNALQAEGRLDDAIASWREALRLRKDYVDAYNNLANGLKMRGWLDEAIGASEEALRCDPASAEARLNLGNVLLVKREFEAAEAEFRRAISLRPHYAAAHNNLGNALSGRGEIDAAAKAYEKAVEIAPNDADGHANLGSARKMQGNLDFAIAAYRRAVELAPRASEPHSNLIYALCFHLAYDAKSILDESVTWDERHAQRLAGRISPHQTNRGQERRLRIGYVSPDFRDHVIGRNVFPLFREHDRQRFEVYGYSNVALPDEMSGRFRGLADVWRNISGLNDAQAAAMIRADKIDILVDLALHLSRNRLLVFAYKPAPVQVTFAGYPGGTGLETMDFRLTDPHLDPPGETDGDYREKSIRLPDSFWCYDPEAMTFGLESEPPIGELPAGSKEFVTFGYLGNFCKVNDAALRLWAAILRATDHSRLLLLAPEGSHRQRVLDILAEEDVDSSRVSFALPCKRAEYLRFYDHVDIELDTTPYNGHTTSLDALWMGAPVVTLVGKTVTGRAGLSQARNLGLTDLVAYSPEEYVRIASDLAGNRDRLKSLRSELRDRMRQSPLTDARRFTRGVEAAYEQMWRGA